jgi:hypothetical protein
MKFCSSLKSNESNYKQNNQEPDDFYRPVMSTMIDPRAMLTFSPDTMSTIDSITTTNSSPELVRNRMELRRPTTINQDNTLVDHNVSPLTYYDQDESFDYFHSTKIDFKLQLDDPRQSNPSWPLSPMYEHMSSTRKSHEIQSSTEYFSIDDSEEKCSQAYQKAQITSLIDSLSEVRESNTFVCQSSYEASFVGDVTVQFADTVKIIRECNNDWLVVKITETGQEGFVPKNIVIDLKLFINKLKLYQEQLDTSLEQSYIFPVKI